MGGSSIRRTGIALVGLATLVTLAACGGPGASAPATTTVTTTYEPLFAETAPTTTAPAATVASGEALARPDGIPFAAPDGSYDLTIGEGWALGAQTEPSLWLWGVADRQDGVVPNVTIRTEPAQGLTAATALAGEGATFGTMTVLSSGLRTGPAGDQLGVMTLEGTDPQLPGVPFRLMMVVAVNGDRMVSALFGAPTSRYDDLVGAVEPYLMTLHPH